MSHFFIVFCVSLCLMPLRIMTQSCTGCDITVTTSDNPITINAPNQKVCFTGNFTFSNGINYNNNATTVCVDNDVTFSPNFQNGTNDVVITYDIYGIWNTLFNFSSSYTINNYGQISPLNTISGTLNHFSSTPIVVNNLSIANTGTLFIGTGSTISASSLINSGSLTVEGNLDISGNLSNNIGAGVNFAASASVTVGSNVINDSNFNINGNLQVLGNFQNNTNGDITNQGQLNIAGNYTANDGSLCSLTCGIVNVGGNLQNNANGGIAFDGSSNCGEIGLCVQGSLSNSGLYGAGASIGCPASCTILPIRLTYFRAYSNADQIILNWETASEKNNRYFSVERSANGIDFEEVARLNGKEKTETPTRYT
ncbi:MAG: hypothetical protein ACFCUI_05825 [Bernardetiaceae bacterium]